MRQNDLTVSRSLPTLTTEKIPILLSRFGFSQPTVHSCLDWVNGLLQFKKFPRPISGRKSFSINIIRNVVVISYTKYFLAIAFQGKHPFVLTPDLLRHGRRLWMPDIPLEVDFVPGCVSRRLFKVKYRVRVRSWGKCGSGNYVLNAIRNVINFVFLLNKADVV